MLSNLKYVISSSILLIDLSSLLSVINLFFYLFVYYSFLYRKCSCGGAYDLANDYIQLKEADLPAR